MTPLHCPSERLSIYIRAYSLFVCSVAQRPFPLFERRSHTWHNDLIPTGADYIPLISHYFWSDRSKVKRQSEGEMLHCTVNTEHRPCLDWSLQSSWNRNLSWWVFNSTNKLIGICLSGKELLSPTDIPLSPSHHHPAALSDCWTHPAAICRASNLSAKGLNACIPAQVKSQQQF